MLTVSVAVYKPDLYIFEKFLKSIKTYTPELKELIVFINSDNHEEIQDKVLSIFPDKVLFQKVGMNVGFGKAHNLNAEEATGEYFAVLNDDVEFYENWATLMIKVLQDRRIAQVGPRYGVCNTLSVNGGGHYITREIPEYIEGSCFVMRTDLAREYGPFDKEYEMAYYEDSDLGLRLRRDGYELRTVNIDWMHHTHLTVNRIQESGTSLHEYAVKNAKLFRERWEKYLKFRRFD